MNFYRFKLALARLKLTGKSGTISIFVIFLEPSTDYDLSNKIRFIIFWVRMNPTQIYEFASIWIYSENKKQIKCHWAESAYGPRRAARLGAVRTAAWHPRGGAAHACGGARARFWRRRLHRSGGWPATHSARTERQQHGAYRQRRRG
jgi:hypothetical protein